MKPVVSAFNAWTCTVISCFAIVILSVLGSLFQRNHFTMMGMEENPKDNVAVATSIFISVGIYVAFLLFCGYQGYLNMQASRRGAISLR